MTYGITQKRATYNYRNKIRNTAEYQAKVRLYNTVSYAKLLENPARIAAKAVIAKLKYYYAGDPLCDIRRLYTWMKSSETTIVNFKKKDNFIAHLFG